MALPKINPVREENSLQALSFQESMLYVLEDVRSALEKQNNVISALLKVETEELTDEKLQDARAAAEAEEERKESKFSDIISSVGSAVVQKGKEVASNFSGSSLLSTLIGGAVLAAFFAPEKFDEVVGFVKQKVETYGPAILDTVGKFLDKLDFSDLLITGIFGLKGGIFYSVFKFVGESLKETVESTFGVKFDNFFANNIGTIFGAAGLLGVLFPGATLSAIGNLVGFIGTKIKALMVAESMKTSLSGALSKNVLTPKVLGIAAIALAAGELGKMAIDGITGYFEEERKKLGPEAEGTTKKGLLDMAGAVGEVLGTASRFAGIGAAIGTLIMPGIGTAVGAAFGGIVGAVIGAVQLDDAKIERFKRGLSQVWENIMGSLSRGLAKIVLGLPTFMVPNSALEWANTTLGQDPGAGMMTPEEKSAEVADAALTEKLKERGFTPEEQEEFKQKVSQLDTKDPKLQQKLVDLTGEYGLKLGEIGSNNIKTFINTQDAALISRVRVNDMIGADTGSGFEDTGAEEIDISPEAVAIVRKQNEIRMKSQFRENTLQRFQYQGADELDAISMIPSTQSLYQGADELDAISMIPGTQSLDIMNQQLSNAGTPQQSVNVVSPTVNNTNNVDQSQNNSYSKTSNYNNLKDMYSPEVVAAKRFAVI
jgi:hypothetical protein